MFYWRWLHNLIHPVVTTKFPFEEDPEIPERGLGNLSEEQVKQEHVLSQERSLALRHIDCGSCNGCESELQLLSGPDYDFSRFGFSFSPSPRHADIIVVTGVITPIMATVLKNLGEALPTPKRVIAIGDCATNGGIFEEQPSLSLGQIASVSATVVGCPPAPADILRALLAVADGHTIAQGGIKP